MKVLVTGTEGYLGCLLAPLLMDRGHDVLGVDTGYYKQGWLYGGVQRTPRTLVEDVRRLGPAALEGVHAVVHMAELSNDPAGALLPDVTHAINHAGSLRLAHLAKAAGVERFVYMSSCSVYGAAAAAEVDETSALAPQTTYALCKSLVERDLRGLADDDFSPTSLRNATAFGASPRMRFDLVINDLAGSAWTIQEIRMTSDGTPWRPVVHALDIAQAIVAVLDAPRERVHDEILNVGASHHNYQVRDLAEVVGSVFPGCRVTSGPPGDDTRSYRVNFDKIRDLLGYRPAWDAERGARQLRAVFERIGLTDDVFAYRPFARVRQLEHLVRTEQVDRDLYWAPGAPEETA
jgi:nucleoside-diphosphate-sugar epimerase